MIAEDADADTVAHYILSPVQHGFNNASQFQKLRALATARLLFRPSRAFNLICFDLV
eukprot:COSAG02_NODE_64101_length_261_cov_0.944444_1_plen_56_part_10